jgi:hypothetical protein
MPGKTVRSGPQRHSGRLEGLQPAVPQILAFQPVRIMPTIQASLGFIRGILSPPGCGGGPRRHNVITAVAAKHPDRALLWQK